MANFKIAALQKILDSSVPLSELDLANKQYNELTAKYRDMLQKDNLLVQRTTNMEHLEVMLCDFSLVVAIAVSTDFNLKDCPLLFL